MLMKKVLFFILTGLFCLMSSGLIASQTRENSMADVFMAVPDIEVDAYWNPALLPDIEQPTLISGYGYKYLYEDMESIDTGGAVPEVINQTTDETANNLNLYLYYPIQIKDKKTGFLFNVTSTDIKSKFTGHYEGVISDLGISYAGNQNTSYSTAYRIFDIGLGVALNDKISIGAGFDFVPQVGSNSDSFDNLYDDYSKKDSQTSFNEGYVGFNYKQDKLSIGYTLAYSKYKNTNTYKQFVEDGIDTLTLQPIEYEDTDTLYMDLLPRYKLTDSITLGGYLSYLYEKTDGLEKFSTYNELGDSKNQIIISGVGASKKFTDKVLVGADLLFSARNYESRDNDANGGFQEKINIDYKYLEAIIGSEFIATDKLTLRMGFDVRRRLSTNYKKETLTKNEVELKTGNDTLSSNVAFGFGYNLSENMLLEYSLNTGSFYYSDDLREEFFGTFHNLSLKMKF